MSVKWGVLGTANIARGCTIPGMKMAENCELYAIAGRNEAKVQSYKDASTKSSAFLMLGGILNVATSVLFFAMEASKKHVYGSRYSFVNVGWPAYVIGALLVITGLASMYIAFRCLQSERKDLGSKKSYSYLKK